jgi:hypothetical protein
MVRAATVAPGTAHGRSSAATTTSWRPAVRLAPAVGGTQDSLAQAGRSPCSPRIRALAMTLPPSGSLTGVPTYGTDFPFDFGQAGIRTALALQRYVRHISQAR